MRCGHTVPICLAGYSGGGVVAFEMAQQLKALGEEVPLLVFFDTYHPQMPIRTVSFGRKMQRLRKERPQIRERDRAGPTRSRAGDARAVADQAVPPPGAGRCRTRCADRHLTDNFGQAAARYRPQPWQGKAILFRAESVPFVFSGGGPYYGWDRVVLGGVQTVMIPGNHDTLLLGANAKVLMGPLNAALDRANMRIASKPALVTARVSHPQRASVVLGALNSSNRPRTSTAAPSFLG